MKVWMKLACAVIVIGVFDSIMIFSPAFAPIPYKSLEATAQRSNDSQNQGHTNQTPSPPIPAIDSPVQTRPQQKGSGDVGNSDKQQQETTVTVRSLPQVTLTKEPKTIWDHVFDWGPWVFNFGLLLVGGGQVGIVWKTLGAIQDQANKMQGQLTEMQIVSDIENRTLILQYRPRVTVRNATAKAFSEDAREGLRIAETMRCVLAFQIVNTGGSPAHIFNGDVYLISAKPTEPEEAIRFVESTHVGISEQTLQPGERTPVQFGLDTRLVNDTQWKEFHAGDVSKGYIYLLGNIWYRDDLGIPRQTGVHRKYDPTTKRFIPDKDSEQEYTD